MNESSRGWTDGSCAVVMEIYDEKRYCVWLGAEHNFGFVGRDGEVHPGGYGNCPEEAKFATIEEANKMSEWWNRQTRQTQNLVPSGVRVRLPPSTL